MNRTTRRFENLVRAYAPELYRYAYWLSGEPVRAEELVQATFTLAAHRLDKLHDARTARIWLYRALRHEYLNRHRPAAPDNPDLPPQEATDTGGNPLTLRETLLRLPLSYREPLVLQVLVGLSLEDMAEVLRCSPTELSSRLFRARRRLRDVLSRPCLSAARKGCEPS